VTKVRWVIESRNGHIDQFKALGDINNRLIAHIITDYKIVAAIINCFYIKLLSDGDNASNIAIRMNNKIAQKNINLDKYWNSINDKDFMLIDANNVKDFPKID
jgi:hypothetical protein